MQLPAFLRRTTPPPGCLRTPLPALPRTGLLIPALLTLVAQGAVAHEHDGPGKTVITHAGVMSDGGFPYRITKPGSYKLESNLATPLNTGAIVIESSNVTLDLNGFNVTCRAKVVSDLACITDVPYGEAPPATPYTAITVQNGSVTVSATGGSGIGYYISGITLRHSQGALIERIHFDAGVLTGFSSNGLEIGYNSIVRYNIFTTVSPSLACPGLIEGNVNQSGGGGLSGLPSMCVFSNNVGISF